MTDQEKEEFAESQDNTPGEEPEKPVINYPLSLKRIGVLSPLYEKMIAVHQLYYESYNEKISSKEVLQAVTIPVPYHTFRMFMNMGYILDTMVNDPKFMQYLEDFYGKGEELSRGEVPK